MSSDINVITLSGRLGADGELRVTAGGAAVLKLRIACNETWVKDGGQKQERVDWLSAEIWGRRAEALAKHMNKGTAVVVSGRLRAEKVGDGNATKYYHTIRINELSFMGGESRQKEMPTEPDRSERAGGSGSSPPVIPPDDSDIPFILSESIEPVEEWTK